MANSLGVQLNAMEPFDQLLAKCSQAMDELGQDIMLGRSRAGGPEMLMVVVRGKEAEALEAYLEVVQGIDKDDPSYGGIDVVELAQLVQYESKTINGTSGTLKFKVDDLPEWRPHIALDPCFDDDEPERCPRCLGSGFNAEGIDYCDLCDGNGDLDL